MYEDRVYEDNDSNKGVRGTKSKVKDVIKDRFNTNKS